MCKSKITRLIMVFFVLTLLVAGCAKKPVAEEPMVKEEPAMTEMREEPVAKVEEQKMDEQAEAARRAAEEAEAAIRKAVSGLMRIHFDFDQYVLTTDAKATLERNADLLNAAPSVKVQIEGHCDERGSDEYNLALGEKRALATKNYLVSLGVGADRMSIISYGEEIPLDPAHTEGAWAKNRRADFKAQR